MATKKKNGNGKSTKTKKVTQSRRDFVKTSAAVAAGVAVAGTAAGCSTGAPTTKGVYNIRQDQFQKLLDDKVYRDQITKGIDDFAKMMVKDSELRTTFLEGTESVLLVRIYNENKSLLEQVTGPIDGRSLEGRLKKMIYVSELFDGVSGLDGIYTGESEDPTAAAQCWGCSCGGGWMIGCCICHFWSWNGGGRKYYCCWC